MKQKQLNIMKHIQARMHRFLDKIGADLITHPIFGGVVIIITYFMLDSVLMTVYNEAPNSMIYLGLLYAIIFLFLVYIRPHMRFKNQNPYLVYGITCIGSLALLGIVFFYDDIIGTILPILHDGYLKPQVILLCLIAPILEELAYRYLLYDKWAKKKWGTWRGAIVIGLIFIVAHPIVNTGGFALYWLPTILFYIVYNTTGLYGSIIAHVLFNIVALL